MRGWQASQALQLRSPASLSMEAHKLTNSQQQRGVQEGQQGRTRMMQIPDDNVAETYES